MFAIIYEFDVNTTNSESFLETWHTLTLRVKTLSESAGSILHKLNDTTWVAYASWPSKDSWEQSDLNQAEMVRLREQLLSLCDDIRIVYQLDVVNDLISS